ncbi:hypothetical protein SCACP_11790 [Sporomusa carbonis]
MQDYYNISVRRYFQEDRKIWDDFIINAKNGHFFFQRGYMEYHSDRFTDYSLMFYYGKELIGVLPANRAGNVVYSHQGLTYGGLITSRSTSGLLVLNAFSSLLHYLKKDGVEKIFYKIMPYIFFDIPAEEDRWVLHSFGAQLVSRELSSVLYLTEKVNYSKLKKRNIAKAQRHSLDICQSTNYDDYMALLKKVLATRHDVEPVHTADQIRLLAERFPENIKLHLCYRDNTLLAGTIAFINRHVVHTQYLANSDEGRNCGALDYLLNYLISNVYADKKYFSFGISTENGGQILNSGLLQSKEGFGARGLVHDLYILEL